MFLLYIQVPNEIEDLNRAIASEVHQLVQKSFTKFDEDSTALHAQLSQTQRGVLFLFWREGKREICLVEKFTIPNNLQDTCSPTHTYTYLYLPFYVVLFLTDEDALEARNVTRMNLIYGGAVIATVFFLVMAHYTCCGLLMTPTATPFSFFHSLAKVPSVAENFYYRNEYICWPFNR